ncbi:hypothetical protein [Paenibacillus sp. FSL R5-0914]|uniref:hypothetical protein n=1 Tax=Paenibacillus sp. FSL R5-0914 TaxID=2921665 RepID=UPI0030FA7312
MNVAEFNFKVDLSDKETVRKWKNILGYLAEDQELHEAIESTTEIESDEQNSSLDIQHSSVTVEDNAAMIKRFMAEGSDNQSVVLKWMAKNPGNVSAAILKKQFPFLEPHGALSGVFRMGRWENHLGGDKSDCPFKQVAWLREGYGVYRGIHEDEAALL